MPHSGGRGSGITVSCDIGGRRGLDLALQSLRYRQASTASILLLAWECPFVAGCGPKKLEKKKKDGVDVRDS